MINETVPAVVAEYRRDLHDMIVKKQYVPTADYLTRLLDRIEAADNSADGRRMQCAAPGNAAATRAALVKIHDLTNTLDEKCGVDPVEIRDIARAALSAPARNCDVGTPEEQAQRFHDFCVGNSSGINGMCKLTCPCIDCFDKCQCLAKWAQTPYEAQEGATA